MSLPQSPRHARGVSLIELMVALAIGSLLILGLVEVFAASRTAYQLSEGLARVQENGRFAIDYLQRDLRMAGHLGCVNDQSRFLPQNDIGTRTALASTFLSIADQTATPRVYQGSPPINQALRFDVPIEAFEAVNTASGNTITPSTVPTLATAGSDWSPAMGAALFNDIDSGTTGKPVTGSDVLILRYLGPEGAQMTSFTAGSPNAQVVVDPAQWQRLTAGDSNPGLFGIADCMNAAVFQASATTPATGTIDVTGPAGLNRSGLEGLQSFVGGQAQVYRAETIIYYVGRNANNNPALYRLRYRLAPGAGALVVDKQELVEGIESMQLQFGQDSFTNPNVRPTGNIGASVTANNVQPAADPANAWRRVGLVQIGLVARSLNPAAARQREATVVSLSALGVRVTPPDDTRYRTVYEQSIALRNRLFGN